MKVSFVSEGFILNTLNTIYTSDARYIRQCTGASCQIFFEGRGDSTYGALSLTPSKMADWTRRILGSPVAGALLGGRWGRHMLLPPSQSPLPPGGGGLCPPIIAHLALESKFLAPGGTEVSALV